MGCPGIRGPLYLRESQPPSSSHGRCLISWVYGNSVPESALLPPHRGLRLKTRHVKTATETSAKRDIPMLFQLSRIYQEGNSSAPRRTSRWQLVFQCVPVPRPFFQLTPRAPWPNYSRKPPGSFFFFLYSLCNGYNVANSRKGTRMECFAELSVSTAWSTGRCAKKKPEVVLGDGVRFSKSGMWRRKLGGNGSQMRLNSVMARVEWQPNDMHPTASSSFSWSHDKV